MVPKKGNIKLFHANAFLPSLVRIQIAIFLTTAKNTRFNLSINSQISKMLLKQVWLTVALKNYKEFAWFSRLVKFNLVSKLCTILDQTKEVFLSWSIEVILWLNEALRNLCQLKREKVL